MAHLQKEPHLQSAISKRSTRLLRRATMIVLSMIAVHTTLSAQEEEDSRKTTFKEIELDEVVVTGTGTAHFMKNAPVMTEVITSRDLQKYNGSTIEEILSALSPALSFGPGDMGSNIRLNGLKNDYILILIDGRRINGDVGGQNDLGMISPHAIDRIEIVKGASSSLYGSDAIAGVINIITKRSNDRIDLSSSTRVGCYGEVMQTLMGAFTYGKLSSDTKATFRHSDGWQTTSKEWDHHEVKDESVTKAINRSTNFSVSQNLQYKITPNFAISADAIFYRKWIDRPTGKWRYYLHDYFYRNQDYGVGLKWRVNDKDQVTFSSAYGMYNYYFDYTGQETTNFFSDNGRRIVYYDGDRVLQTESDRWLNQLKGVFYLGDQHILSTGLEHQDDVLVSPYRLKDQRASAYTLSAYAQDEWTPMEQFNVTAGVRYVYHKAFGSKFTPRLSMMYKVGNFNLRGTYSMGFKAPTIKELYQNYIASIMGPLKAYYGNEELKPQTSQYGSLGVEYRGGKLRFSLTGYYNHIDDMIALNVIPTSREDKLLEVQESMQYQNLAYGRTYGIDATASYRFTPSLRGELGYSYNDSKALYTDDPKDVNYMKLMPMNGTFRHSGTARLTWSRNDLDVTLFGRAQSTKYYITNGNGKPYTIWRINVHDQLIRRKGWILDVNAGVDNIFNYIDRTPYGRNRGTSNPGTTLFINLQVKFKQSAKA